MAGPRLPGGDPKRRARASSSVDWTQLALWRDASVSQWKMLMWKLKTVESPLSEIAEVTVSPCDSGSRAVVANGYLIGGLAQGREPYLKKPWNASREMIVLAGKCVLGHLSGRM